MNRSRSRTEECPGTGSDGGRATPLLRRIRAAASPRNRSLKEVGAAIVAIGVTLTLLALGSLARTPGMHTVQAAPCPSTVPRAPVTRRLGFSGRRALEQVARVVDFGPRTVGSTGHQKAVAYILATLRGLGLHPVTINFATRDPEGHAEPMTDITVSIRGTVPSPPLLPPTAPRTASDANARADTIVLATHYDTKRFPFRFVGANDGGSGTGALLEFARVFTRRPARHRVVLVFFDGEEAFDHWKGRDHTYGSRYLARLWQAEHVLPRVRALILLDMIGYSTPCFCQDVNSSPWLVHRIWHEAKRLGATCFEDRDIGIEDDHTPFVKLGVQAADVINFEFGPHGTNRYWHTPQDTLDKLSAKSMRIVGRVVEATVRDL